MNKGNKFLVGLISIWIILLSYSLVSNIKHIWFTPTREVEIQPKDVKSVECTEYHFETLSGRQKVLCSEFELRKVKD